MEEPDNERNIRLWFNAARRIPSISIDAAIERLTYLYTNNKPLDALYYLYVLQTLKALDGSDLAKTKAEGLIKQTHLMARNSPRTDFAYNWLGHGPEMTRLVHFTKLGRFNDELGFYEKDSLLVRVKGKIAKANRPEVGYIELRCGLRAFFVPQRRRAPMSNFGPMDVNKDVDFYLGFSYEGLRAWSVDFVR
jgi:hypothetical protein